MAMNPIEPQFPADAVRQPSSPWRGATASLALSMLLASLGTSIANIALPALAGAFARPFPQVQAVVVAYLAGLTVSVLIAGHLGDRHGLKPTLLAGLALFATGALLCGIAPSLGLLTAARVLQGVGAAFLMTLSMALMRETADPERLGRAMGMLGTVSAIGTALGPSLGGMLVSTAGWRSIFLVQVPLTLLAGALTFSWLPHGGPGRAGPKPSWMHALDQRMVSPLLVNGSVAAVMMATLVVGPFYLGTGLGLKETQVGLVMAVGPVISIFGGIPAGRRVDAWGSRKVLAIGLGLLACGAFLLSLLPGWIGVAGYLLAIAALTPGYQLFQAANNTAMLADVPQNRRGTVSGLLGLSRNLGLIAGASLMGSVFAFGAGTADLRHATPQAMADGLRLTFAVAGIGMLVAIAISFSWSGGRRKGNGPTGP
ncbi:MFS transporter [Paracidovorax citrulli]|uniref:MFS transporter n=1 Tax=Paracidovorax citrulli TaxID=80869 RepID=UPI00190FF960|nr:MFS transporter [Paracidovorax citrulli]